MKVRDDLGELLPKILPLIRDHEGGHSFFDFASAKYVNLKDGFDNLDFSMENVTEDFIPKREEFRSLGICFMPVYPVARLDGKKICNILREQRKKLAALNHISFESEECPSIGPCAGTCEKCDRESVYLAQEMQKIPCEKRIYPQFDPEKELNLW